MDDTALDLLADLRAVGLALRPDGISLHVCPRSKLTDARRQAILDHKRELLAVLRAERMAIEVIKRAGVPGKQWTTR